MPQEGDIMLDALSSSTSNNALNQALSTVQTAQNELSSGSTNNALAAADFADSVYLTTQAGSTAQASSNISDTVALVGTANAGLDQTQNVLQQLNTLTVQAGDPIYSASDRQILQTQFNSLTSSLNQIASSTQYNGQNLLDGTFNQTLQTGPNAGDSQTLSIGSASANSLNVAGLDITNPANVGSTLSAIGQAIGSVTAQQTSLGALSGGLTTQLANLNGSYENLVSTNSTLSSTDYAAVSSNLQQGLVQSQAAIQATALYQQIQSSTISQLL